jgi:hypothetical protein
MTTKKSFFNRFAAIAALTLMTLFTTAQVQQVQMNRYGPITIQVGVQDFMFEFNQASGVPLGYVVVDVADCFGRDYSGLSGSSEFTVNFDQNIVDYGKSVPSPDPVRIGILGLKDALGGAFQVRVDGGKTTLCFPMGYETGEEELRKLVRLVRTKDGRLAAMVTFGDKEGIFKSLQPGIKERICMVLPLQENTPEKSLKLVKDKEGNIFALLLLRDGISRVKASGSGKANLGVTILTPSDKAIVEKIGMTLVVVN